MSCLLLECDEKVEKNWISNVEVGNGRWENSSFATKTDWRDAVINTVDRKIIM